MWWVGFPSQHQIGRIWASCYMLNSTTVSLKTQTKGEKTEPCTVLHGAYHPFISLPCVCYSRLTIEELNCSSWWTLHFTQLLASMIKEGIEEQDLAFCGRQWCFVLFLTYVKSGILLILLIGSVKNRMSREIMTLLLWGTEIIRCGVQYSCKEWDDAPSDLVPRDTCGCRGINLTFW